jgi:hypothetical protein
MNTLSSESILGIPSLRSPLNICSLIYILGSSPLPTNLFNTGEKFNFIFDTVDYIVLHFYYVIV